MEWSGGEGREGQGRAGQGSRLLRWTFTGRDFIPLNTPVERAATYFVSKRPENCVRIAKFPYAAFGRIFAFHCPLFFTRNNDLGCKSSRSAVVVSPFCGR